MRFASRSFALAPVVALAILAGCGKAADKGAEKGAEKGSVATKPAATGATSVDPAPVRPEGEGGPDGAFQALAKDAAKRTNTQVAGWGVADLDDETHQVRYAVLRPDRDDDGAYLLEAGDRRWYVPFTSDGHTAAWGMSESDGLPKWATNPDHSISHQQAHSHGYDRQELAIRGGALVILSDSSLEDSRESQTPTEHTFAKGGVCTPKCPPLARTADNYGLHVPVGPVKTLDELLGH